MHDIRVPSRSVASSAMTRSRIKKGRFDEQWKRF
jgi:hypothetical protein